MSKTNLQGTFPLATFLATVSITTR